MGTQSLHYRTAIDFFRDDMDTLQIAELLGRSEADIYNEIAAGRDEQYRTDARRKHQRDRYYRLKAEAAQETA